MDPGRLAQVHSACHRTASKRKGHKWEIIGEEKEIGSGEGWMNQKGLKC